MFGVACEATAAARLGSECNDWLWCWREDILPDEAAAMAIASVNTSNNGRQSSVLQYSHHYVQHMRKKKTMSSSQDSNLGPSEY